MKKDKQGRQYWRSLEQQGPEFEKFLHREFPDSASELGSSFSRRKFLALMGASISLAGLAGCRRPVEKIIPYVIQPEEIIPGNPLYYATTMPFGTSSYGLIVETHEGRPTKIEGNKNHPSTLGSSNSFMQAEILNLYDPDRSKEVVNNGTKSSWGSFVAFWSTEQAKFLSNRGEGLAIVSESFSSPTYARQKKIFMDKFPLAMWAVYEPSSDENVYKGIEGATSKKLRPDYHFDKAKRVVSFESDFLGIDRENVSNTRGFSKGRKVESEEEEMNRLYVVESGFSITGSMADHRIKLQSRQIGAYAAALAQELQRQGLNISGLSGVDFGSTSAIENDTIRTMAKDILLHNGESIVIAGDNQPASVHALVFAINSALSNNNSTINYHEIRDTEISDLNSLRQVVGGLNSGSVTTVVHINSNPVYNSPSDFNYTKALSKAESVVHFGLHKDETAMGASWHIPAAHFLESWGDSRAADGTASIVQPMIAPLFDGKMQNEFLNLITFGENETGHEIVRSTWRRGLLRGGNFESRWKKALHDGVLENSSAPTANPRLNNRQFASFINETGFITNAASATNLEVTFMPCSTLFDGRYSNNGWMQELPDSLTKLTWDNAAVMNPKTAEALSVENEELVTLTFEDRKLEMPVWIVPGIADNSIALSLGYGRKFKGKVANGAGFNTYDLRGSSSFGIGLTIAKTSGKYELASTQNHWSLEGRNHIFEATMEEYKHDPKFEHQRSEHPPLESLWEEKKYNTGYQWGMAIDLNTCTGCNACTVSCQSENNIPVVGKERVQEGREMHWIRIDRYFASDENSLEDPEVLYQPMGCVQCEMAPCEAVCPVAATLHDDEGINNMVYNRCIGTRYCSNNCPTKVRRFNFFDYTSKTPETLKMSNNPDVTVRSRGVMEKCNYCLQRLNRVKSTAKLDGRVLHDGEATTACQQACPAEAITFGDINDPNSRVSQVKKQNKNYEVLEELNLKARTTYLAKLRNPNPEITA